MLTKRAVVSKTFAQIISTRCSNLRGRSVHLLIAIGCAIALLSAAPVYGQSYQGSLRGAIRDNTGNVMPGATLTLVNEETNVVRTTVTNDAGEYAFERVDPGRYKVTATVSGFKKTDRANVLIETQQQVTIDLSMSVGDVAETVVITSDVPLMETSTASTGTVISKQLLDDLPNSGRNPFAISAITPTVIPVGNPTFNRQQDQTGSSAISLGGGPVRGNNYIIDGVPITDLRNRAVIIPTIEAVQDVKVQVNTYDAEAGRTGGGFFNTSARSGSNDLHGSLFGFIRPSALQANNFFNNRRGIAKPNAPYKLYGGSVGGAGALPLTGMVGATASLKSKSLVADRRKLIKDIREDVFAFLQKNNIEFVPSVSNCFMVNAKMPTRRLVNAMQKEKVYIGRVWPAWPTYARVSVGTKEEMAKFKTALIKVMNDLQA